jgi:2-(1,2-epoxy-1,2-dihydrophenyl)acetyl-CoA isomerase
MTDPAVLLTDVTDRIGTITMNRPERRNALDGALVTALDAATKAMASDPEVKVVVLTGAAPAGATGGFCSGGDTKGGRGDAAGMALAVPPDALAGDLSRHDLHAAVLLHTMPKPSIAMVGGPAVGAGFSLAGACDLRFASEDALFAANFLPNGLAGDYGGTIWWTRIAGTAVARRAFLLNEKFTAHQALELGMVHEVLPGDKLRERVYEVARQLVRAPAAVLALVKDDLNQAEDEVDRRRWLFANEAENQGKASAAMMARRQRAAERAEVPDAP